VIQGVGGVPSIALSLSPSIRLPGPSPTSLCGGWLVLVIPSRPCVWEFSCHWTSHAVLWGCIPLNHHFSPATGILQL